MNPITTYTIIFWILFVAEFVFIRLAEKRNLLDNPNERSSHSAPVVRGGGFVIVLSLALFFIYNNLAFPFLFAAVVISGIVSFVDDVRGLPSSIRFAVHVCSSFLLMKQAELLSINPVYLLVLLIVVIGVINAYNFMDGINGITGFYSLAVIFPLLLTETNDNLRHLDIYLSLALLAFLFFNARKKALCFAGDIGSVSVAIIIIFLLVERMFSTRSPEYIAFLLIYGIDSVLTIIQRLFKGENIFRAHRKHLYQYLTNEIGIPHLYISVAYALLQLGLNMMIIYMNLSYIYLIVLCIALSIGYIFVKRLIISGKIESLRSASPINE